MPRFIRQGNQLVNANVKQKPASKANEINITCPGGTTYDNIEVFWAYEEAWTIFHEAQKYHNVYDLDRMQIKLEALWDAMQRNISMSEGRKKHVGYDRKLLRMVEAMMQKVKDRQMRTMESHP